VRSESRPSLLRRSGARTALLLFAAAAAQAQLSGTTDVDLSNNPDDDEFECTISQSPREPLRLFVACNQFAPGLFATRSEDGGVTWLPPKSIASISNDTPGRDEKEIPAAFCDPSTTWDSFGNLYLAYIGQGGSDIVIVRSTDGGATFSKLQSFHGSVDQPTIVAADIAAGQVAVWAVWNQGPGTGGVKGGTAMMVATGAIVTGRGDSPIFPDPPVTIPKTEQCSFGDVAIAPGGAVVEACQKPVGGQGPSTIYASTDPDGLGPQAFGDPVKATETNVGGFASIPAQARRTVDAEAGLAFDTLSGRLYLVYTDGVVDSTAQGVVKTKDLDIKIRTSTDNGATWSVDPIRVNDDQSGMSQFLPRIAMSPGSSKVSVCWYDCRESASQDEFSNDRETQVYCSTAAPASSTANLQFAPNVRISDAPSMSNGTGGEYGDYSGLTYGAGLAHPVWAKRKSVGKGAKEDPKFEAMTDRVGETEPPSRDQVLQRKKPARTPTPGAPKKH
jgi:hypothetical protein